MKSVVVALALLATPAAAQSSFLFSLPPKIELPITRSWVDADGKILGTATFSDNRVYLRDHKGTHIATVVTTKDGVTYFDPNGKVLTERKELIPQ